MKEFTDYEKLPSAAAKFNSRFHPHAVAYEIFRDWLPEVSKTKAAQVGWANHLRAAVQQLGPTAPVLAMQAAHAIEGPRADYLASLRNLLVKGNKPH